MNKIERLSRILVKLQSRKFIIASQIADEYGVSLRTIYRDLRILEQSGIPITAIPNVGYSLVDGYRLPPLMFTPDEAFSFLMAERLLSEQSDESTYLIYKSGMDKIRTALKVSERNALENFEENVAVLKYTDVITDKGSPHILSPLLQSIRNKTRVIINYRAGYTKEVTFRCVEAVGLYFMNNQWYLLAWCCLRNDYRTFKLTRIISVSQTEEPFAQAHPRIKSLLGKIYAEDIVYSVTIKVAKEAMYLTGGNRHHGLVEETACDDSFICRYHTFSLELFARWFLSFADKAEVIEPIELKDIIREQINNIASRYS